MHRLGKHAIAWRTETRFEARSVGLAQDFVGRRRVSRVRCAEWALLRAVNQHSAQFSTVLDSLAAALHILARLDVRLRLRLRSLSQGGNEQSASPVS